MCIFGSKRKVSAVALIAALSIVSCTACNTSNANESSGSSDMLEEVTSSASSTNSEAEGSKNTTFSDDSKVVEAINTAVEGLRNYKDDYCVSVGISTGNESKYYLEVNGSNGSYTQYSIDDKDQLGKTAYETSDNTQFVLFDWLTPEGKGYLINQSYVEGENSQWLELPDTYTSQLLGRRTLFLDTLLKGGSEFKKEDEPLKIDLGDGEAELDLYTGKINSAVFAEMIGVDTVGLYSILKRESTDKADKSVTDLMDKYIEELNMNMVFSDAKATIGIRDGVVRMLRLEVGGLGSRMVYVKTVLAADSSVIYETPSFEGSSTYYSSIKELADYVAKYGSYEEAMSALYNSVGDKASAVEGVEGTEKTDSSGSSSESEASDASESSDNEEDSNEDSESEKSE